MRLFAWLRPFSDPTYPRSWDFIRPRVAALPSQPLPTRRTLFTLSSFRSNVQRLCRLAVVAGSQSLENGPVALWLALEVFSLAGLIFSPLRALYGRTLSFHSSSRYSLDLVAYPEMPLG